MKSIMGLQRHRLARVFWVSLASLVAIMISQGAVAGDAGSFDDYLAKVRSAAILNGIASETVDGAFKELTRDERVIGYDRKQPEFVQTFDEYLTARVTSFKKQEGRKLFRLHQILLDEIAASYKGFVTFGKLVQYFITLLEFPSRSNWTRSAFSWRK